MTASGDANLVPPDADAHGPPSAETVHAVRNAFMLGASLVATWTVALLVRLLLPRTLGPALFGEFNFADALAANAFGFLGLGIDMYIQKELPARPEHASEFIGGMFALRVAGSLILFAALALSLLASGRPHALVRTVLVFGMAQLVSICAATLATVIYASQNVRKLAVLNVASKLLWAGAVGVALCLHAGIEWFALAFFFSEAFRLVSLLRIVRTSLVLRIDAASTWRVLVASAPFYVAAVAGALYAKIDVSIMGMLMPDREVGFYSSAANISSVAMLMAPLMGWVLMPQLSRAAARSREDLGVMFRRSIEWVLIVAVPVSMMLALGADQIVPHVFGAKFLPAIGSLRVLSPIFVAVYVAMLASTYLNLTDRSWRVTLLTMGSLALNALLNVILIRPASRWLGEGGAGIGAAAISMTSELLVAAVMLGMIGRPAWDRRNIAACVKSLAACALVSLAHVAMRPLGPARLAADLALYLALIVVTGAVHLRELLSVVRSAAGGRHAAT
jgi:O-antigen/teichoic acid export membrane protein